MTCFFSLGLFRVYVRSMLGCQFSCFFCIFFVFYSSFLGLVFRVCTHVPVAYMHACTCILEVCVCIQLGCLRIAYVCARMLLPINPNSFLFIFLLFYLYAQPHFNLIHIYLHLFTLFSLVLFYLFYACQGFNLFKYLEHAYEYEHALMHKCFDVVRYVR